MFGATCCLGPRAERWLKPSSGPVGLLLLFATLLVCAPPAALAAVDHSFCPPPGWQPGWTVQHQLAPRGPRGSSKEERDAFGLFPHQLVSENFVIKWGDEGFAVSESHVLSLSEDLESSWQVMTGDWGFPLPYGSSSYLFNIYLSGSAAIAPPSREGAAGYYTSDPAGYPMIALDPVSVSRPNFRPELAVHELFHAMQYTSVAPGSSSIALASWYVEASANWAASEIIPAGAARSLSGYALAPHPSVYAVEAGEDGACSRCYGAFVLPRYLTERTGDPLLVPRSWQSIPMDVLPLDTLDGLLADHDLGIAEAFASFAAHNATWDYEMGLAYRQALAESAPGDLGDHRYALSLEGAGSEGWQEAPEATLPGPFGYNILRLQRSEAGSVHVGFRVEARDDLLWWVTLVRAGQEQPPLAFGNPLEDDEGLEYIVLGDGVAEADLEYEGQIDEQEELFLVVAPILAPLTWSPTASGFEYDPRYAEGVPYSYRLEVLPSAAASGCACSSAAPPAADSRAGLLLVLLLGVAAVRRRG